MHYISHKKKSTSTSLNGRIKCPRTRILPLSKSFRLIQGTVAHGDRVRMMVLYPAATHKQANSGLRLSHIRYHVQVIDGSGAHEFLEYAIRIGGDPPYRITADPIVFAQNAAAQVQSARLGSIPPHSTAIGKRRGAVRLKLLELYS